MIKWAFDVVHSISAKILVARLLFTRGTTPCAQFALGGAGLGELDAWVGVQYDG